MNKKIIGICIAIIFICFPLFCYAESFLEWGDSSGVVEGYRIYYGTVSGNYPNSKDVAKVNRFSLDRILKEISYQCNTRYYFVVKAYNQYGESDNSSEISFSSQEIKLNKVTGLRVR